MKVVQPYEQTPKQLSNPTPKQMSSPNPTPKVAHQGLKQSKMIPKLGQNQMSELKEIQKMKVVQIHQQTPKKLPNPTLTPKITDQGSKSKNYPKIKSNSNVGIEGNIDNESCLSRPQNSCRNLLQLQKQPIRAPKCKNDSKIKSKSNARIQGNIENESCSIT